MFNQEQKQTVQISLELLNKILAIMGQLPYQNVFMVMDEIRALGGVQEKQENNPQDKK